jgi:hypothetical protein
MPNKFLNTKNNCESTVSPKKNLGVVIRRGLRYLNNIPNFTSNFNEENEAGVEKENIKEKLNQLKSNELYYVSNKVLNELDKTIEDSKYLKTKNIE